MTQTPAHEGSRRPEPIAGPTPAAATRGDESLAGDDPPRRYILFCDLAGDDTWGALLAPGDDAGSADEAGTAG